MNIVLKSTSLVGVLLAQILTNLFKNDLAKGFFLYVNNLLGKERIEIAH